MSINQMPDAVTTPNGVHRVKAKRKARRKKQALPKKHTGELITLFGGLFVLVVVVLAAGYYFMFN